LVDGRQVVAFQASVIETCSAGTGLNKHKALQQFFGWLVAEGEIERSPMIGSRSRRPCESWSRSSVMRRRDGFLRSARGWFRAVA
jgi:hypothetical protein